MLDHEALALVSHGYTRYWLICQYCPTDGLLRLALPFLPEGDRWPCAICSAECDYGILPCVGFTRRPLPFFDRLMPALVRIWLEEDEVPDPEPQRMVDDEHYVSPSGRVAQLAPKVYRRRYPVPAP